MNDDSELLRRYAEEGAEPAFSELVSRHLSLVYHAALRQVGGDARRAEEVAQAVFIDLARKASGLARRPGLAGWLHTSTRFAATNLRRAEHRRQIREQEAFAMNETLQSADSARVWERVRPVIDEALHGLAERDREAVLLRFFEGLTFSAVGAKLAVSEDAARVRVERALEKIRRTLIRHGVTSTSAALATALASQAGAAAPAALAVKISATALAASAGIGAGAAGIGFFTLMTTTKTVALTGILALLTAGIAIHQGLKNQSARTELATARRERDELRTRITELERQISSSTARARAAEEDGATLLGALDEAAKVQTTTPAETTETITHASVEARYKWAQQLAKAGQGQKALKEFLWCYDEGMLRVVGFGGVRSSYLLDEIAKLGKTYPPALEALRARRDQAERTMLASADDLDAAISFGSINRALGETGRTFQTWEQLAPDDRRRTGLGHQVYDTLVKDRRYKEAAQAMPYRQMTTMFDSLSDTLPKEVLAKVPDAAKLQREQRAYAVKSALGYVEVLAGAGDQDHARELAAKLLKFDNSAETQSALRQGLARVGQAKLLDEAARP